MTHPEDDSSGVTRCFRRDPWEFWEFVYQVIPGNVPECEVQVFPGFCIVCLKFVEFPGCRIQVISGFYGDLSICVALARTGETARSKVWDPLHNIPPPLKIAWSL